MAGSKGARMTVNGGGGKGPNSDINMTPLIDVVLVLLIIFMVVTPLLEKDIEIRVPETEKMEEDVAPPQDQLIVALSAAGEIAINSEKVTEADYIGRLRRMVAAKPRGERLVFFMPDEKVNYAKLIAALDGARQAGAEILGMMTEPAEPAAAPAEGGAAPAGAAPTEQPATP